MAFQADKVNLGMFRATKRRLNDDDDVILTGDSNTSSITLSASSTAEYAKRMTLHHHNNQSSFGTNQPVLPPQSALPSITYASPDYRPPPRSDALWLQPVQRQSPVTMMDEDSTDEETLLTPSAFIQCQTTKDLPLQGTPFSQVHQL